ncbi:MAG: acetolactate synthase large subunit [Bacteroidetes bacterium]|nr:acetolactate synthase large subunit [Bacteroidota bacterium]
MKASDLFVKALENEGVEYIFTVPGEETLDLIDSIRKSKQIKLVVLRHEQGAGFIAATYGRLTGKAGVCLVTLGPGATNLMTATAFAQLGGMPMVVISGQKSIKKHKQGEFQIIDVVSMMSPITKMAKQIVNANNITSLVRNAFHISEEERPGVVHLELPEDIAKELCESKKIFEVNEVIRPIADIEAIKKAIILIQNSVSPLLLIGAGANRKRVSKALNKFVEKLKIPFFTTQMGKGVVDEKNELFLGTAAISEGDFLHEAIKSADLIINAGHDIVEKPPFLMQKNKAKVIHINFMSAHIDDTYFPNLEVIGDIAHSFERLTNNLKIEKKWNFKKFKKIKENLIKDNKKIESDSSFPVSLPRLIREIQNIFPNDGILTLDNGLYKIWFSRNYLSSHPSNLLLDNALATMGAGLSSAIASKIVYPNKKVIAICGDGGFLMNSQEIESARRLNLDLIIMILVDNAYGMIKWKQQKLGYKDYGMTFQNPDFEKYAQSYNIKGYKIKNLNELGATISECLNNKGIKIIEIPINYDKHFGILK